MLDEPTNGLDPHGIAEIRAMLRSFADEGMTVFVSSHLLAEIQQVCEHLVVIESGRLLFQGGVDELLRRGRPSSSCGPRPARTRGGLTGARSGHRPERRVTCRRRRATTLEIAADCSWAADLNRLAMANGITLVHLSERRSTLEEAFFEITGLREGTVLRRGRRARHRTSATSGGRGRTGRPGHDLAGVPESEWVKMRRRRLWFGSYGAITGVVLLTTIVTIAGALHHPDAPRRPDACPAGPRHRG